MDQLVQRRHVTFGCCGQNFSEEYVDNGSGKDVTYGFGMFEEEDDAAFHSLVKQMLADVFDRMHMCEDEIETTKLKNPLPFNHKGCDELFANFVREALGALLTRREEFTIQVKNLSQWERVWCHKDGFNCAWNSYTKTLTLCFTWVDALGDIWSLRLVSNSRAKGGNHLNKTYKLPEILTRMRRLMGKLNGEFEKLMLLQQNVGGHRYPNGLTYKTWENIILEDCSPWLEVDIGNGIMQKQMGFTAGCVRKLFLAGPCTIVYLLNNRLGVEEKAVELAIHAKSSMACRLVTTKVAGYHCLESTTLLSSLMQMVNQTV
jgi:hypothetical protein